MMTEDERSFYHLQILEMTRQLRDDDIEKEKLKEFATAYAKGNPYAEKAYILEQENKQLLTELKKIKNLFKKTNCKPTIKREKTIKKALIKITKKEIEEMPILKDCTTRLKTNGYYEIRYRRSGIIKSFSNKSLKIARQKAYAFLKDLNISLKKLNINLKGNTNFIEFSENYIYTIKKAQIKETSLKKLEWAFYKEIEPLYRGLKFKDMLPMRLQEDLTALNKRVPNTAETVRFLLNGVFKYAIANDIIDKNPLQAIYVPPHERKNGQALSYEEEKQFLIDIKESPYRLAFIIFLYTGCRGCEFLSLKIDIKEDTITFDNGKRRKWQKDLTRTMPIFPMLRPYIPEILKANLNIKNSTLNENLKRYLKKYSLRDLRHTFSSRAKECGCNPEVVNFWQAHVIGTDMTAQVYTHFSLEYQRKQAELIVY